MTRTVCAAVATKRLAICVVMLVLGHAGVSAQPAVEAGTDAHTNDAGMLDAYVREALAANPVMTAGMQSLLASRLQLQAERAQRLPSLDLQARYTRASGGRSIDFPAGDLFNPIYDTLNDLLEQQGRPAMFPTDIANFEEPLLRRREQDTRLSLRAPLYAPAIGAGIAARVAVMDSEQARLQATARSLVREVKRAYFGAARADAAARILRASLELLDEDLRVAGILEREGVVTSDRVLRASAEQLAATQRLDAAEARSRQARRRLAQLLGRESADALTLPSIDPQNTDSLLPAVMDDGETPPQHAPEHDRETSAVAGSATPTSDAVEGRPELARADAAIAAAEARTRAAGAQRLPELSLAADYGIEGRDYRFESDADFATVSLVLRWNLFDFGRRSAARDAAAADSARLRAERDDLERQLRLALQQAMEDLAVAERAVATARARVAAAEAAFEIAERKRAENTLTQVAFLDAERALTEARLNAVITRYDLRDQRAEVEFVRAAYPLPALPIVAEDAAHDAPHP